MHFKVEILGKKKKKQTQLYSGNHTGGTERDAESRSWSILREAGKFNPVLMHCFSYTVTSL